MTRSKFSRVCLAVLLLVALGGAPQSLFALTQQTVDGASPTVCLHSDPVAVPAAQDGTQMWEQMLAAELDRAGFTPAAFAGDPTGCGIVLHTSLEWKRKRTLLDLVRNLPIPPGLPLPVPGGARVISTIGTVVATAEGVKAIVATFTDATKPNDTFKLTYAIARGGSRIAAGTLPEVKAVEGRVAEVWTSLLSSLVAQVRTHAGS